MFGKTNQSKVIIQPVLLSPQRKLLERTLSIAANTASFPYCFNLALRFP
nr:MAG TPA: RalF C-terminal Sec-7 capping domain [Caudoviricetes sp.]